MPRQATAPPAAAVSSPPNPPRPSPNAANAPPTSTLPFRSALLMFTRPFGVGAVISSDW